MEDNSAISDVFHVLVDHLIRDEEPLPTDRPAASILEEVEAERRKKAEEEEEESMPEMQSSVFSDSEDDEGAGEKESVD